MPHDDLESLNFSEKLKSCFKNREKLRREIESGKSAQNILGVSDKDMLLLYQAARALLDGGKIDADANAFLFLATLNPKEGDYWLGLGSALVQAGDVEGARDALELSTFCGGEDPLPYFHLAKLLFGMGEREATLEALDWTLEMASHDDKYKSIREEATAAKKLLKKPKKRPPSKGKNT